MEKFEDILSNIKERISNPFVFSFIVSWIVCNWPITVALIWYNENEIHSFGCKNIFDFIKSNTNGYTGILYPLLFAVFYSLGIPFLRNFMQVVNAKAEKWGENWSLKISEGGKVPIEKYLRLRQNIEKRTKDLEEAISKETHYMEEIGKANKDILEKQTVITNLSQHVVKANDFRSKLYDSSILNGYWQISFDHGAGGSSYSEYIYINNEKIFEIQNLKDKSPSFTIIEFHFDEEKKEIFFIKRKYSPIGSDDKDLFSFQRLKYNNEDQFNGTENYYSRNLSYRRTTLTDIKLHFNQSI